MTDTLIRAIDKTGSIRAHIIVGRDLVDEARKTHGTSMTATAALGRALMAGLLLRADLKEEEASLTLNIMGEGDLGRIVVTGHGQGQVKGYVDNPQADLPPLENNKLDVGGLVGRKGTLQVVMDLGLKKPYQGQVDLISGEIAEDVAYFLHQSNQVRSGVGLGVLVDPDLVVRQAGGFIINLLPDASDEAVDLLEKDLAGVDSVTSLLEEGMDAHELLEALVPSFEMEILQEGPVVFECQCSQEKVIGALAGLPDEDLQEMIEEDEGAEATCHFCNKVYKVGKEDLQEILTKR